MDTGTTIHTPPQNIERGFTLIELLIVIAIIGLLVAGTVPIFNSIAGSRGVTQAAYDLSAAVEEARATALGRQTYVWLAVQNATNAGNTELKFGLVYSKDGSTNMSATNLQPLSRAITINKVALTSYADLKSETRALNTSSTPPDLATNKAGAIFSIGTMNFNAGSTLTFTSRGEVLLNGKPTSSDGFDPNIAICLRQARGTTVLPDADDAAVIVEGSLGIARILRLQ